MAATRNKCVASQLGDKGDHCGEDHCLKKYIKRLYYHGDMLTTPPSIPMDSLSLPLVCKFLLLLFSSLFFFFSHLPQ